jgi:hypothetical protein
MSNSIPPTSPGHVNNVQQNAPTPPAGAEQEGALHGVPVQLAVNNTTPPPVLNLDEIYNNNAFVFDNNRDQEVRGMEPDRDAANPMTAHMPTEPPHVIHNLALDMDYEGTNPNGANNPRDGDQVLPEVRQLLESVGEKRPHPDSEPSFGGPLKKPRPDDKGPDGAGMTVPTITIPSNNNAIAAS